MMQVLTVVNSLGFGGIETLLLNALPHLKKRGIVILVTLDGSPLR